MKKLVGFDLDGVFLPDLFIPKDRHIEPAFHLSIALQFRCWNLKSIFTPTFEYVIITGRPTIDQIQTEYWINKFLNKNLPKKLFIGTFSPNSEEAKEFKTKTLNENVDITSFIESDLSQVNYLKENVRKDCEIIHFESLIMSQLEKFGV